MRALALQECHNRRGERALAPRKQPKHRKDVCTWSDGRWSGTGKPSHCGLGKGEAASAGEAGEGWWGREDQEVLRVCTGEAAGGWVLVQLLPSWISEETDLTSWLCDLGRI